MNTAATIEATLDTNKELSAIFKDMSKCYQYLGVAERFRSIAYDTAAKTIANLQEPVESYGNDIQRLDALKGIGESIAEKIIEYVQTGKIETYEKLKKSVPVELLKLMDKEGIGAATIRHVHDAFHIEKIEELQQKIDDGQLHKIKGIAKAKEALLLEAIKLVAVHKERLPFEDANKMAIELLKQVSGVKDILRCAVAGSIRRKKETIGDIDIVVSCRKEKKLLVISSIAHLTVVRKILSMGDTKLSVILKDKNMQADFRIVEDTSYGAALLYFTGSKEHNIQLRLMAKKRGLKINEYGVYEIKSGQQLAGKTEEEVYRCVGLHFIHPEDRRGKNEFSAALLK